MRSRRGGCRALAVTVGALLSVLVVATCAQPQEQTWVEVDGVVYGARADERGPLGGGEGYAGIVTGGDHTATTVEELVAALEAASPGETVFIPGDVELDLTTLVYIEELVLELPGGVTLASDRGSGGSPGALLFSDALDTRVMIRANGPDARVTGLRIQGPNTRRRLAHHRRSFGEGGGGHEYYYRFPTQRGISTTHGGLEVDNCAISGFGHAGVHLRDGDDHHVHHCFIHHCQYNGLGYGVSHNTASSLIECNLFDFNRHSIAGTGRPGCGYVARNNVELGTSLSHCFDMHGGRDRDDGTKIAGTTIEMHNNTFGAPKRAIAIRGVPEEYCRVHHNWFVHYEDASGGIRAEERTEVYDNAWGEDASVR